MYASGIRHQFLLVTLTPILLEWRWLWWEFWDISGKHSLLSCAFHYFITCRSLSMCLIVYDVE
jgi:hypothetical protein